MPLAGTVGTDAIFACTTLAAEQELAVQMKDHWTDFAEYGVPDTPRQPNQLNFRSGIVPIIFLSVSQPQVETCIATEHQ